MPRTKKEAPPAVNMEQQMNAVLSASTAAEAIEALPATPAPKEIVVASVFSSKPVSIRLEMDLLIIRPDIRQYKQNSAELQPRGFGVAIDVPNTPEMFAIVDAEGKASMLTPAGLVYLQKQLELPYQEWAIQLVNSQPQAPADDLPWDEEKKEVKVETKSTPAPADDDEWETETKTEKKSDKSTKNEPEENWNEDWS